MLSEFGQRLRGLRKQKNLSQRDLAARVGIDFTYLSKIEGGRLDPPSEAIIQRLAQVLEANEDELINLAGKVPRPLKAMMQDNPLLVELVRVISGRTLPDEMYQQLLDLAQSEEITS